MKFIATIDICTQTLKKIEISMYFNVYLAATSESPMDDLHSLWATCHFLCRVVSDRGICELIDVCWFAAAMLGNDHDGYVTLLAQLTDISNPEACYVTGMNNAFSKGTLRPGHASLSLPAPSIVGTMWPPSSSSGPIPVPPLTKLPHLGNSLAPMGTSAVAGGIGAVRRPSCR